MVHASLLATALLLSASHNGYIFDRHVEALTESSIKNLDKVSPLNESIELDDGSIWQISFYDWPKIQHWTEQEIITITQNTVRFSNYPYRIVNRKTGVSVEALLSEGPIRFGPKTTYVDSFDLDKAALCLSNGSIWKIHPKSLPIAKTWDMSQPIALIIGDNSQMDCYANEDWAHILIDVSKPDQFLNALQIF